MAASIRISELPPILQSDVTNTDLFVITDKEAIASKKITLGQIKENIFSNSSVQSFADVDITTTPPQDGQFLQWSEADQQFKPGDISLSSLGELADVDLVSVAPADGQTLIWAVDKFVPGTIDLQPLEDEINDLKAVVDQHRIDNLNDVQAEATARATSVNQINVDIIALRQRIDDLDYESTIETLDSIQEIANALQNNPDVINNLDSEQATQDGRLDALETAIDNLDIDIAPETLNSIDELSQALNDDPNFLSSVTNDIAQNGTDISNIETILYKLIPQPPTTIANLPLTVTTNAGTERLCVGFTDRTSGGSGLVAGSLVKRNTDGKISTNKFDDIGPGDSGDIDVKISSATYDVSTSMAAGTQVLDFMGLKITDNKDASLSTRDPGIPAGFYQTYDIQLVDAYLQHQTNGLHEVYITHAGNSSQKAYFYEDESTPGAPTLTTGSIYMPVSRDLNYSSGIPHFSNSTDNEFHYSLFAQNLSGEMYDSNTLATSSQTSGFTHQGNKTYVDFGGTNPPAANFGVGDQKSTIVYQYPRDLHTQITNNVFSNWTISTPYGSASKRPSFSDTVNIMGNTARTNVVDEDNISVSNLGSGAGNAFRVGSGAGDNPAAAHQDWVETDVPAAHEATVVGGKLKYDRTNYSVGFEPVGPDLSDRAPDPQYAEFKLVRSGVSQFTVTYSGSCSGCWVKMPTNANWNTSLSGTNGWADMFQAYRGSGVPTTAEPGCSSGGTMDNNGGSFTCVFGTESSSNDSENTILVRWKLSDGQTINSMSFSA